MSPRRRSLTPEERRQLDALAARWSAEAERHGIDWDALKSRSPEERTAELAELHAMIAATDPLDGEVSEALERQQRRSLAELAEYLAQDDEPEVRHRPRRRRDLDD